MKQKLVRISLSLMLLFSISGCGERADSEPTHKKESKQSSEEIDSAATSENAEDCFDIIETADIGSGDTVLVEKVYAKTDAKITRSITMKDEDGHIKGPYTDTIDLVKGENNFFIFYLEDLDYEKEYTQEITTKAEYESLRGEKDCVELLQYKQADYDLYLKFKQKADKLNRYAKFKLLFYKNGKIVHAEVGSFAYSDKLKNKGDEDIISIPVSDFDYDKIEYICEP